MSSKFTGLLAQARNRTGEEDPEEEEVAALPPAPASGSAPAATTPAPARRASVSSALPEGEVPARGRPRNGKRSDPAYTQITAYILKKTHQDVKVALLREGKGRELSEVVEECLAAWLHQQK